MDKKILWKNPNPLCYNNSMPSIGLGQIQSTSQIQTQRLSQQQIQSLKIIGMSTSDLRQEILNAVEENPALEIVSDVSNDGINLIKRRSEQSSVRTGISSAAGSAVADEYQSMLENVSAPEQTLQEHLLQQLNMTNLSETEFSLCKKIIENLDEKGFYIFAPVSLLEQNNPLHTESLLENCINKVRHFDPAGICCANIAESLEIQALLEKEQNNPCPPLALFILHGHLDFLENSSPEKIKKKILDYLQNVKNLAFRTPEPFEPEKSEVTAEKIQEAVNFISSLNPHPYGEFRKSHINFTRPDIYVVRQQGMLETDNFEKGLIKDSDDSYFKILPANDTLPVVSVSRTYEELSNSIKDEEQFQTAKIQLKSAENFVDLINFRNQVLVKSCCHLVKSQIDFFRKGPGNLVPINQKQFAEITEVHESTVSRMADSKFIQCDWGLFPFKYFFSNAIQKKVTLSDISSNDISTSVSTDTVRHEIEEILKNQKPGEKRLSDQKIADILKSKGYEIARRTVSKYRTQLNISSSYNR